MRCSQVVQLSRQFIMPAIYMGRLWRQWQQLCHQGGQPIENNFKHKISFKSQAKCLARCGKDELVGESRHQVCHLPLDRGSCRFLSNLRISCLNKSLIFSGDFVRWGGSTGEGGSFGILKFEILIFF